MFNPAQINFDINDGSDNSKTFARHDGTVNVNNCYYKTLIKDAQGATNTNNMSNEQLLAALGSGWETVTENNVAKVLPIMAIHPLTGDGSTDSPYEIASVDDWNNFACNVFLGMDYEGAHFELTHDISITRMVGYDMNHTFKGIFDGDGHTITVTLSSSADWCAPFAYTYGATNLNLATEGTINTYGSFIPETGGLTSSGDASPETYNSFEYKIPTDADGALITSNVIDGSEDNKSVTITIPAGIYDWCITNPSPNDRVWIASQNGNVGGRQNDFTFEAGKHYTFTVTLDGYSGNDCVNMTVEEDATISDQGDVTNVTGITSTSYSLSGLTASTEYTVYVQSVKGDKTSEWSKIYFTTLGEDDIALYVAGYGDSDGGYVLLASPVGTVNPENVDHIFDNEYDLYAFDQNPSNGMEWHNYEANTFNLEPGKGYLYANSEDVVLVFPGTPYNGDGQVTLSKTTGAEWEGWNLVGNPFNQTDYISDSRSFYTMNDDGSEIMAAEANGIAPMEGVFVIANYDEEPMTFTTTEPETNDNGKDYAVVNMGGDAMHCVSTATEIPVSFKAQENGTYTLDISAPLTSNLSTLTLIDHLTGTNIDLLATPSYTFEAKVTDYADRFKLVFKANEDNTNNNDNFAFISNGQIIVNGEGVLQIVDVMGRIIVTNVGLSQCGSPTAGMTPGMYVLRLINGDNVKTQKIVIQ